MTGTRTGTTKVTLHHDLDPTRLVRLNRLARELRLTGQILAEDLDGIEIVEGWPYPGSTSADGREIKLDWTALGTPWTRHGIAVWIGTFAHELGHSKFTPRAGTPLMRRVHNGETTTMPGIHRIWNIVEDARQERLMLAQFGAWKAYLSAAIAKHIDVRNPEAFVLLVGRTWLPQEVRDLSRALYVASLPMSTPDAEAQAAEIARLIGVYQRLGDPGDLDSDVAWLVIEQLWQLVPSAPSPGCGHKPMTGGWPEDGDEAQQRAESIPTADDEPDEDDDDESDDEGGDDPSDDESDDEGGDEVATNDEPDDDEGDESESDDADGDGDGDDPSDDDGDEGDADGDGDDEGGDTPPPPKPADVADAVRDAVREMLDDDEVAEDLDRIEDSLDNGTGCGPDGPPTVGKYELAGDGALYLERDVTEALMDLREAAEPGWHRRVGHGKLSVRRFLTDPNWTPDDVFDRFDPGQLDCTALEVVLIADISGSMDRHVRQLGDAVWAIRRAVDGLEGRCTAITFHDGWHVMAQPDERPDGRVFVPKADGGTNPVGALREAVRLVAESEAMHRIVMVLTDGCWAGLERAKEAVAQIKEAGGTTVFVGLDLHKSVTTATDCAFDFQANITKPGDLALLFRDVAFKLMAEAMAAS